MVSQSLLLQAAAATLALARTPSGFAPESNTDLVVEYGGISADNGVVVSKQTTANQPQIGLTQKLGGSSFTVIMVDLDIPTNNPPQTSTLLHWMQMGLTLSNTPMMFNTTSGRQSVFLLQNSSSTAPAAMYLGPNPPARVPLSHRYTQVLVDTSSITQQQMNMLMQAAQTRQGFDPMSVLMMANLMDKVVAGNSFNVTNPGSAQSGGGSGGTGSNSSTGGTGSQPSNVPFFSGASSIATQPLPAVLGLATAALALLLNL